jgi:hypothetical protein
MARGWESKSVEAQMEESSSSKASGAKPGLTEAEAQAKLKRADLQLSRRRVVEQLEQSTNERYSTMLRSALAELDAQIAGL